MARKTMYGALTALARLDKTLGVSPMNMTRVVDSMMMGDDNNNRSRIKRQLEAQKGAIMTIKRKM